MPLASRRENRRTVLRLVAQHPGAHLRELERLAGLSLGSLRHHLDRLEGLGLVRAEPDARFKRFFLTGIAALPRRAAIAVRQGRLRRILAALLEAPRSHGQLADSLQIPRPSLTTYLRRLVALQLVQADAHGRFSVRDPSAVRDALALQHASLLDRLVDDALRLLEETG